MLYPEHYTCLSENEQVYTCGGDAERFPGCSRLCDRWCMPEHGQCTAGPFHQEDLQEQYPEKNGFELIQQAHLAHMSKPSGLLLDVASVGLLIGALFA